MKKCGRVRRRESDRLKAQSHTKTFFHRFQNWIAGTHLKWLSDSCISQSKKSDLNRTCTISTRQHEKQYKGILKIIFGIYTRCQQIDILK